MATIAEPDVMSAPSSTAESVDNPTHIPSEANMEHAPSRSLTPIQEQEIAAIVFHADADLFINVDTDSGATKFKVNASNLGAASPAWNRLLYGNVRHARPQGDGDEPWMISVRDNADALSTMLQIVHYRFDKVPKAPTVDEMYDILALTAKYDCTNLIFPWTIAWISQLEAFVKNPGDAATKNYKVALIAWELGCVQLFREMTDSLILTSTIDSENHLVHSSGIKLQDMVLPLGLLDRIQQIRSDTLGYILNALRTPFDHFAGTERLDAGYCKVGKDKEKCEAMLFGTALPKLIAAGLFPVPQASGYHDSLTSLKKVIYNVQYGHWEGKSTLPHQAHTGCNLGLRDSVKGILEAMDNPVDKPYLEKLFVKAKISGFDNGTALNASEDALNSAVLVDKSKHRATSEDLANNVKSESFGRLTHLEQDTEADGSQLEKIGSIENDVNVGADSVKSEEQA